MAEVVARAASKAAPAGVSLARSLKVSVGVDDDEETPLPPIPPESSMPPAAEAKNVEERVEHCMLLMSVGEWDGYPVRVRLAKEWGISETTVRGYSATASHHLRLDKSGLDEMRLSHAAFCERIKREAATQRSYKTGLPDWAAALRAAELAAKFQGIDLEPQHQPGDNVAMRVIVEEVSAEDDAAEAVPGVSPTVPPTTTPSGEGDA